MTTETLPSSPSANTDGEKLRQKTIGTALSFTWLGVTKALDAGERKEVGALFDADSGLLSMGKRLIDAKNTYWRRLAKVRSRARDYWHDNTVAWVEPGKRLLNRRKYQNFVDRVAQFNLDLASAVEELEYHRDEVVNEAERRLGRLFDRRDYPATFTGLFGMRLDFPELSKPAREVYEIDPERYEQEQRKITLRFEEAVQKAETAFAQEFAKMAAALADKLKPNPDGTRKTFRNSSVGNLKDFFLRFRELNVRDNSDLEALITRCETALGSSEASDLRIDGGLREQVAATLGEVTQQLSSLVGDAPRRLITRRKKPVVEEEKAVSA